MAGITDWQSLRHRAALFGQWARAHPLVADSVLAVMVAVPLAWWSLEIIFDARRLPWSLALALAVIAVHTAIAFRRVSAVRSFIVVSVASFGLVIIPNTPVMAPSLLIFPLSLYAYIAYGSQRWASAFGLGVGVAGSGILTAQWELSGQSAQVNAPAIAFFATMLVSVLAAWGLGLFRRVQRAYVAALVDRATRAEAEREERARRAILDERARIAREMHDVIAHSLAVIVSQAQGGQYAARTDPKQATESLATIAETGRQALADMRGLLGMLHPDSSAAANDNRGPQPTLRELPELLNRVRGAGLSVRYNSIGTTFLLSPAAELALYRVVQEALTNTLKHGGPGASANVEFAWGDDGILTTVRDTGHSDSAPGRTGRGLVGMRDRLAVIGGTVSAEPGQESGFVVQAWLPRHAERTESSTEVPA